MNREIINLITHHNTTNMANNIDMKVDKASLAKLQENINKIPWYFREEKTRKIRRKGAKKVIDAAKIQVEINQTVDTFRLRDSIQVINKISKGEDIYVGPTYAGRKMARHAHLIEFGFRHHKSGRFVPPKPFMRPAYELTRQRVVDEMLRETEKLLKKINMK